MALSASSQVDRLAATEYHARARGAIGDGLLLARPAGGPNLLQRLLAIALDIEREAASARRARAAAGGAARSRVAARSPRRPRALPTAAAIDSAAKVSALLIGAATAAGADAADLAAELRRQPTALAQASTALAHGQQLAGSRAVVALLGEPQMDDLVSGLSPVLHEPLMRVVLRGDVNACSAARPRRRRCPRRRQRAAAAPAAARRLRPRPPYVSPTASASPTRWRRVGRGVRAYRVLEWLRRGWHAAQTPLDLGALRRAAPPEVSVWRELGAVVHRTRVAGKEARAAVRPEYVRALLPPFEAVLREAARG